MLGTLVVIGVIGYGIYWFVSESIIQSKHDRKINQIIDDNSKITRKWIEKSNAEWREKHNK